MPSSVRKQRRSSTVSLVLTAYAIEGRRVNAVYKDGS